jgi:hypothetical protein
MKEHDGCVNCKWEHVEPNALPCVVCRGDLYEPINDVPNIFCKSEFTHHSKELVHHPAHYCYSEYEPKDVIRAWGLNFNLGSAVKYIARAGRKDDILQELNKAKQFIEFEIEAIEKERGDKK